MSPVVVREEWSVVDRWWTDEPVRYEYVTVTWSDGRRYVFKRTDGETTWRFVCREGVVT